MYCKSAELSQFHTRHGDAYGVVLRAGARIRQCVGRQGFHFAGDDRLLDLVDVSVKVHVGGQAHPDAINVLRRNLAFHDKLIAVGHDFHQFVSGFNHAAGGKKRQINNRARRRGTHHQPFMNIFRRRQPLTRHGGVFLHIGKLGFDLAPELDLASGRAELFLIDLGKGQDRLGGSIVALLLFIAHERRFPDPMIPARAVREGLPNSVNLLRWGDEVKTLDSLDLPPAGKKSLSAAELKMARQLVEEELVLIARRQFLLRQRKGHAAPCLGGGAIGDGRERDQPPILERPARGDGHVALPVAGDRGEKTTAGREDRARLVDRRLDQQFALDAEGAANEAHLTPRRDGYASETGTAAPESFLASRASWRALSTPPRRRSERTVSLGWAPLSSQ